MISLLSIASAFPKHRADRTEVLAAASDWLKESPESFQLFSRIMENPHSGNRHFIMPARELVRERGMKDRAEIFEREAVRLGVDAADKAISQSGVSKNDIDCIIFSSCSCPIIPAPDTLIIQELGLSPRIQRIPAYQFGCAGGVITLALASRLAQSFQNILCINVEICSLVFQRTNTDKSQLVGAAIFGDGAAAAVISKKREVSPSLASLRGHRSELLGESRGLMGYDIADNGPHLRLARNLPTALGGKVRGIVDDFLHTQERSRGDIPWWLFHPGGSKVLSTLEEELEVTSDQCHWSHEVLRDQGNLSSATVMVILEQFLLSGQASPGDQALMLGIGPGLTVEQLLFEIP